MVRRFFTSSAARDTRQPQSYLIVGAGVFGAPTALALKKAKPEVEVTVVDRSPFPSPYAAGHDLNKICRGDYGDLMYMRLAVESMKAWTSDPLYSQHFHQCGMLYAYDEAYLKTIIANWEELYGKGNAPSYLLDVNEAKQRFNGIYRDSDWSQATQSMWTPTAGWADAAAALGSVMQAAIDLGVHFVDSGVATITFDDDQACVGVETIDGRRLSADRTILAAGAYIPYLLAESAPTRPEVHTKDRIIATGAAMCAYEIPDELMDKFGDSPVMALLAKLPAENIPPGEKQLLKCTHDAGFSNKVYHQKSKQIMSIPPAKKSQITWSDDMPAIMKEELKTVVQELYGDWAGDLKPRYYRMCWDGFTPNQDWIFCPHPEVENLYIAGGGSFHGFKFLPVIGDIIVQMLDDKLDDEMKRRFAWDRPDDGDNSPQYAPKRDLGDLWQQ